MIPSVVILPKTRHTCSGRFITGGIQCTDTIQIPAIPQGAVAKMRHRCHFYLDYLLRNLPAPHSRTCI
ncbi:hypothetical protein CY34DRAFT_736668 [Suillus luteus UH-Slu-Lm8-n1]|uniref:Uncharacterized protein n=1 Tax=Suillus luteus UH-Slu-Lm8-n1 TaxID=930992 RepID=A0A0D0AMQ9_9AGAM|nr:hypothetical protein CY34DRAFT_736668 [Suillus luteus UH-Slu-Lm8-n1]